MQLQQIPHVYNCYIMKVLIKPPGMSTLTLRASLPRTIWNYLVKRGSLPGFHNCFPVGQYVDHCSRRMGPGWFGTNLIGLCWELCWTVPGVAILAAAIWECISGFGRSSLAPPRATGVDFTAGSSSQCAQEFYSAIP